MRSHLVNKIILKIYPIKHIPGVATITPFQHHLLPISDHVRHLSNTTLLCCQYRCRDKETPAFTPTTKRTYLASINRSQVENSCQKCSSSFLMFMFNLLLLMGSLSITMLIYCYRSATPCQTIISHTAPKNGKDANHFYLEQINNLK